MMRPTAFPLLSFVLLAAACSGTVGSEPSASAPSSRPVAPTTTSGWDPPQGGVGPVGFAPASLQRFDECAAFLDHIHREGAERVGPYGFGDGGYFGPVDQFSIDVAEFDSAPSATDAPAAAPADVSRVGQATGGDDGDLLSGRDDVSTTNVQVAGVDEPDIVKTDGTRMFAITGDVLHAIDVSPDGTTGTKRSSITMSNGTNGYAYGHEILVFGDRAFVFAQAENYSGDWVDHPVPMPVPLPAEEATASDRSVDGDAEAEFAAPPVGEPIPIDPPELSRRPASFGGVRTLVIEVDLSDLDALSISSTLTFEGRYVSARAVGSTARVVVTSPPQDLGFVFPAQPGSEGIAESTNREIVENSTVEDWVPSYWFDGLSGATATGQLVDCAGIHAPAEFSGFDMLSIVTLDLDAALAPPSGTSTVIAAGETVYASQDRVYVSTNTWNSDIWTTGDGVGPDIGFVEENYATSIHRFSTAGDAPAAYEASGSVAGHLLNQFSMNDRDGVLYAATTLGAPWNDSSVSQIVALEMQGDRLEQVGAVGGLGKGERIFSVRYVGETAYVVTFRQTDPFYIIDLGDPREMRVAGELKIPGFSSYLHPISDTLVLGVGQDATETGATTGAKVSLFDVSNPANPVELDVWTMPNSSSAVEFDHRAFLYWAPTNTVVLPVQSHGARFAGAVVLNVTAEGITERGRITHGDEGDDAVGTTDCRVVEIFEVGEDTELFWITQEGGQVQLCGRDDRGGASGLICDPIPVDDVGNFWNGEIPLDLTGVDRMELCWPDWNGYQVAVQRTMVIDGSLWTLSPQQLQANDLTTLDRTAAIAL